LIQTIKPALSVISAQSDFPRMAPNQTLRPPPARFLALGAKLTSGAFPQNVNNFLPAKIRGSAAGKWVCRAPSVAPAGRQYSGEILRWRWR
jgi:hypothetical protein